MTLENRLDGSRHPAMVAQFPILLVDDYAPFRIAVRHILERYRDFTVIGEACDGNAALELVMALAP